MLAEMAHFALILALGMAMLQVGLPSAGLWMHYRSSPPWALALMQMAKPLTWLTFVWLTLSFVGLVALFVLDDFSVKYVADHSNTLQPLLFKVSATWGAHEGSLLLWVFLLSGWTFALTLSLKRHTIDLPMQAALLATLGAVLLGMLWFVWLTSNPFERLLVVPEEGRSLNPLLQDVGLAIHPPILYMGYVGLAVAFAFAIAALVTGKMDKQWAQQVKPWAHWAWAFLTLGIVLGSWWAYVELGWGGWWFWDPVENASLLPWLVATALIHSLMVTEQRQGFQAWSLLLAIVAFSLSLLGTFLVRSGVLTSVHAFAADPSRGVFILMLLALVVGSSLLLFMARAPTLRQSRAFAWFSKDNTLLMNNVLLLTMTFTVLLGTLYPLLMDALNLGKLSVGAPYFNQVMLPLVLPMMGLMGLGMVLKWQADTPQSLWRWLLGIAALALLSVAAIDGLIHPLPWLGWILLWLSLWVAIGALLAWWRFGVKAWPNARQWGGILAHNGFALMMVGIVFTSLFSQQKDMRFVEGESYTLGEHKFIFRGVFDRHGENYLATEAHVSYLYQDQFLAELYPQKRTYIGFAMPMTEAAIYATLWQDVFIALGEDMGLEKNEWNTNRVFSVRVQIKPGIRLIWLGGMVMALGAIWVAVSRVFSRRKTAVMET